MADLSILVSQQVYKSTIYKMAKTWRKKVGGGGVQLICCPPEYKVGGNVPPADEAHGCYSNVLIIDADKKL